MTRSEWEKKLDKFPEANFLQSWEWGEFHQDLGNKIYRIEIPIATATKGETFCGCFLAIVKNAKRGRHLEVPGGPLLSNYNSISLWKQAVLLMKEAAKKENCVFIRIRPQIADISTGLPRPDPRVGIRNNIAPAGTLHLLGFRQAPMHLHAELTRVLDLTKTDGELLSQMRKSTRYEIRRALKFGIKVEQSDEENLVDEFVKLQGETAKREGFVPFAREYLLEQFRAFKRTGSALWFFVSNPAVISSDQGESRDPAKRFRSAAGGGLDSSTTLGMTQIISMAFVIFYRGEAVYHYAASSDEARKTPAAYAIQWAIVAEAKKRGMKIYNLWGDVADDKINTHRFAGPSLFKRGFGGKQVAYLHAHDLPLSRKYWINWAFEIGRKNLRRL